MIAAQSMQQIFRWPTAIAITSLIGLLSALIGDGVWDGLSWTMLTPPALISMIAICRRREKPGAPTGG